MAELLHLFQEVVAHQECLEEEVVHQLFRELVVGVGHQLH